jgi:HSP20 family protein
MSITLFKDPVFSVFNEILNSSNSFVNSTSMPQSKIKKNEGNYQIFISVPGLTKNDLKIGVKEGLLKISYEKEESLENSSFVSTFVKTYTLPENTIEDEIKGKVENGILEITIPIQKKKSLEKLISLN